MIAAVAFAVTRVAITDINRLLLGISIMAVVISLACYMASLKRRRRDRHLAGD
ncbi:hypothetical protein ACH4GK_41830 [Streptomyces rimosus]|uniref:hypothetical protein n=1 Tax=Streptomyces rimosus TaxID=1927 RepID=UPI000B1BD7D2|nr:hypothetical protein [Streptomyces rimosus]